MEQTLSEQVTPSTEWFLDQANELRSVDAGVGKRVEAANLELRFQSFGGSRVGLRIAVEDRPSINATLQLVRCEVRRIDSGWVLDVVERSPGAPEQSGPFFRDLARRLSLATQESAMTQVEYALRAWRSAFSSRRELLTEEEILGLFGELKILEGILDRELGGSDPILLWTGPEKADHDFALPGHYQIECKTTSPHSERLHISNQHQLEAKDMPLYLACVRASISNDSGFGSTLQQLVRDVESRLKDDGSVQLFHQKLESLGFDRFDHRYEDIVIELTSIGYYEVRDTMPRIVPGDLRAGVSNVAYQVLTNDLLEFKVDELPDTPAQKRIC